MGERYGATAIPLAVSDPQGVDAMVWTIGDFLLAVGNAYAGAEYRSIAPNDATAPAPVSASPIRKVLNHDVRQFAFTDANCPVLCVFRDEVTDHVQVSQGVRIERGKLGILWVPQPRPQGIERTRAQFAWKLFKVFDRFVELGRDPAWYVDGDLARVAAPYMGPVTAVGTSPPTVALTGAPGSPSLRIRIAITTSGDLAMGVFRWSSDGGATWTEGVPLAATVTLGATGLTAAFASATYATDNAYAADGKTDGSLLSHWAKLRRLRLGKVAPAPFTIPMADGRTQRAQGKGQGVYEAYLCEATYEERLATTNDRYPTSLGCDAEIAINGPPLLTTHLITLP